LKSEIYVEGVVAREKYLPIPLLSSPALSPLSLGIRFKPIIQFGYSV
jgi:hypothetical protein